VSRLIVMSFTVSALCACSTPRTVMKNPETGQIARCGGSATGSLVGGVLGYHIQKSNDNKCVAEYAKQGFDTVNSEKK